MVLNWCVSLSAVAMLAGGIGYYFGKTDVLGNKGLVRLADPGVDRPTEGAVTQSLSHEPPLLQAGLQTTTATPTKVPYFSESDYARAAPSSFFRGRFKPGMPRVVIATWCTEDLMTRFMNEVYWKSCYAHAHGFDVLFTGVRPNVSGVKVYEANVLGSDSRTWYGDENMWPWVPIIKALLMSGDYDYVWYVGGDVLIQEINLDFPVWAWDTGKGHDITVMDQQYNEWGLNLNGLLIKPTQWSIDFLDTLYAHRKNFNLQGDNGPYMETILYYLNMERQGQGFRPYQDTCWPLLIQDRPSGIINAEDDKEGTHHYQDLNKAYATCFFKEFDRLAGFFSFRDSTNIGFSKTMGKDAKPWANCWSLLRMYTDWETNCFALHWNGLQKFGRPQGIVGTCPDPTFDWAADPNNADNHRRPKYH